MRTHANELANAWSAGQFFGDGIDATKTLFCGLRLFHVNAAAMKLFAELGVTRVSISAAAGMARGTLYSNVNDLDGAGIQSGRYRVTSEQLPAVIATISVRHWRQCSRAGRHGTWRDVGSDTAQLVLVAVGVTREEARALARSELAPLPSAD